MKLKYIGAFLALTSPILAAPLAYEPFVTMPSESSPESLVEGADGNFYGATYFGGSDNKGYVFRVTPSGVLTVLTNFTGPNGANAQSNLILATNGVMYGITRNGGATDQGTVFSVSTNGTVTTIQDAGYPGGIEPTDVILGRDGNVYGVNAISLNGGNIFKVTPDGTYSIVHEIDYASAGIGVLSLVQDTNGNFYGTTSMASTNNGGSLFKLSTNGTMSVLHAFAESGLSPRVAGVVKGVVYGYTSAGGTNGFGYFFKVNTNGVLTTIKNFTSATGYYLADLKLENDGYFYGSATSGGAYNLGVYFKLSTGGTLTPLIVMSGEQQSPMAVIKGSDGVYYGTCNFVNNSSVSGLFKTIGINYGKFSGIFSENSGVTFGTAGYITLQLSSDFKYSGKVIIEGVTYLFSGQLDYGTSGSTQIIRAGKSTLYVTFNLVFSNGAYYLTGNVTDGTWNASLQMDRAYFSPTQITPKAGLYSMTLLANGDGTTAPGYGSSIQLSVKTNGVVVVSGKLADAAGISQSTTLSKANQFPLYATLYKGTGVITGWITLTNSANSRLQGDVAWIKTNAFGKYYSAGFTNTVQAVGSILQP